MLLSSVAVCYIKRKNKWVDEDIDSFQFGSFINSLRQKGATPFPGLLHFTLDPYLIMVSVKQGGIKYHFWVFGMTDST